MSLPWVAVLVLNPDPRFSWTRRVGDNASAASTLCVSEVCGCPMTTVSVRRYVSETSPLRKRWLRLALTSGSSAPSDHRGPASRDSVVACESLLTQPAVTAWDVVEV